MALSTTRTLLTQTGINTHQVFDIGGLDSVGVATFSNFKTGLSNLHSIGFDVVSNTGTGVTIRSTGNASFTGVITASKFVGDISDATGAAAGLGTALSQTQTDPLNKIYYTDKVLSISTTQTIDHPATANLAYTQYGDIKIEDGHDLIIKDGDDFKYDILGISTTKLADNYFQDGLTIGFGSSVKGNLIGDVTGNINNSTLLLQTGGTERLRIASDGNICIGGDNPVHKLSIEGNSTTFGAESTLLHIGNDSYGIDSYRNIGFGYVHSSSPQPPAIIGYKETHASGGTYGDLIFATRDVNTNTAPTQRMSITADGKFLFLKTSFDQQAKGMSIENHARVMFTNDNIIAFFTRTGSDGQMIRFYGDTTSEGSINISGTSISYNGGVLSRWSQIVGISTNNKADRPTIYKGTVMSNLDEMCDWGDEENMQLNKTQVSTVSGDKNVAGVFWAWDDDDDTYLNDYYVAQTGDYIIRVGAATTITRGDLLESAGDGTAKPQSDDIVRSKTVAKITSGIAHTTYPDGTKTYPCVLMAS